jgi:hypothetical protein
MMQSWHLEYHKSKRPGSKQILDRLSTEHLPILMERRPLRALLGQMKQKDLLWRTKFFPCSTLASKKKDDLVQGLLDGCTDYKSCLSLCSSILQGFTKPQVESFWKTYRDGLPVQDQAIVGTLSSWGTTKAAQSEAIVRIDMGYTARCFAYASSEPEPGPEERAASYETALPPARPVAEERAASYETALPSPAREEVPQDCDQAQATETAVVQGDAHKNIWWANPGSFFKSWRNRRRKAKRQHKRKATRKERAAKVRAAITAELSSATCDKETLRAIVSTQVGFSLEGKFWRYVFEKKLMKAIQDARPVRRAPRRRFNLEFSTSQVAPKKKRQPQTTGSMQRRTRVRC